MRAQRRILIGAAEDNLSIPVMQSVSDWYNSRRRFNFEAASLEVPFSYHLDSQLVCRSPWPGIHPPRAAIECLPNPFLKQSESVLFQILEDAVRRHSTVRAFQSFWAIHEVKGWNREGMADLLNRLALEFDIPDALALSDLYQANWKSLWNDINYSGLALDVLLAGPLSQREQHFGPEFPDYMQLTTPILHLNRYLLQLTARIKNLLGESLTVPDWALDGIHCGGNDPRFSGLWEHMARACDAYEFYGRLDPDDDWSRLPPPSMNAEA